MEKTLNVIIVGAGVIGSSIAYNLSMRGYKVLVIDKGRISGQASSAAAGMLGAQTELEEDSPLFQLARQSRAMYPELTDKLKGYSGIDIELRQKGMYKVAQTEAETARLQLLISKQRKLGEETHWIPSAELHIKEPALHPGVQGAMYIPNDGHVSAPLLTKAFAASACELGAEFREFTEVYGLLRNNGNVEGVQTAYGELYAEHVVVAGGAWSERLLKSSGINIETYPVKGECFSVRTQQAPITGTIFSEGCYIVPKVGGRLIIGATEKAHSFDQTVTLKGISTLMMRAQKLIPQLAEKEWETAWAGIRPQTKEGIPYLGEHPKLKNLHIATGHYRNGILLAPITGKVMADYIEGKKMNQDWVSAFRLHRSTKSSDLGVEYNGVMH